EQYGEWLLENGRYEAALAQFDQALLRMPKRSKSLRGKWTALRALNQTEAVAKVHDELAVIYAQADAEVKAFLTN
ncbi:MAG: hypothetical protein AAF146_22310, partial [Bacteroidota bacterium]